MNALTNKDWLRLIPLIKSCTEEAKRGGGPGWDLAIFQQGVLPGRRQPLDDVIKEIAPFFSALRDALPVSFRLYRGQEIRIPGTRREFLSWTPDDLYAATWACSPQGFAGRAVFVADVQREDVLAGFDWPAELLVRNRSRYLRKYVKPKAVAVREDGDVAYDSYEAAEAAGEDPEYIRCATERGLKDWQGERSL